MCVCVFPHPCSERIMSIKNAWTPLYNNIDKIFHNTYTKSNTHSQTNINVYTHVYKITNPRTTVPSSIVVVYR